MLNLELYLWHRVCSFHNKFDLSPNRFWRDNRGTVPRIMKYTHVCTTTAGVGELIKMQSIDNIYCSRHGVAILQKLCWWKSVSHRICTDVLCSVLSSFNVVSLTPCALFTKRTAVLLPGPRLNIKTVLFTYDDFHVKDKTAVRPSFLLRQPPDLAKYRSARFGFRLFQSFWHLTGPTAAVLR